MLAIGFTQRDRSEVHTRARCHKSQEPIQQVRAIQKRLINDIFPLRDLFFSIHDDGCNGRELGNDDGVLIHRHSSIEFQLCCSDSGTALGSGTPPLRLLGESLLSLYQTCRLLSLRPSRIRHPLASSFGNTWRSLRGKLDHDYHLTGTFETTDSHVSFQFEKFNDT